MALADRTQHQTLAEPVTFAGPDADAFRDQLPTELPEPELQRLRAAVADAEQTMRGRSARDLFG